MERPVAAERLWPAHWTAVLSRAWHCALLRCLGTNMTNHRPFVFRLWLIQLEMFSLFIHSFLLFLVNSFWCCESAKNALPLSSKILCVHKPRRRQDAKKTNAWWFVLWVWGLWMGEADYIAFITFYRKSTSAEFFEVILYNCFFSDWLSLTTELCSISNNCAAIKSLLPQTPV